MDTDRKNEFMVEVMSDGMSAKASTLVNGSLTQEVSLFRGLRKGELLSLFMFLLVAE